MIIIFYCCTLQMVTESNVLLRQRDTWHV